MRRCSYLFYFPRDVWARSRIDQSSGRSHTNGHSDSNSKRYRKTTVSSHFLPSHSFNKICLGSTSGVVCTRSIIRTVGQETNPSSRRAQFTLRWIGSRRNAKNCTTLRTAHSSITFGRVFCIYGFINLISDFSKKCCDFQSFTKKSLMWWRKC